MTFEQIVVKARDLGTPSLTSTATLTVYVEHIASFPTDSGLGFADGRYTVEIEENAPRHTIIKTVPVINKPRGNFPMRCELLSGNEANTFSVSENEKRDCEIQLIDPLDYETQAKYTLGIRLQAVGGVTGVSRLTTQVVINVLDVNDNQPNFSIPQRYAHLTSDQYLAGVPHDAASDSQVIQVSATDLDSVSNGVVTYEILPASDPEERFKIDKSTGILRTSRSMEDVTSSPLRVTVVARDNPLLQSSSLSQNVHVVINVIEDKHRMCIVMRDTSANRVQEMKEHFLQLVQDRTGMIAGWEKAEALKYLRNHTIESDVTGTDVWFYLVEPGSLKILETSDPRVQSTIFETKAQIHLLELMAKSLGLSGTERIRLPYPSSAILLSSTIIPVRITPDVSDVGAALIVLALLIAIFGITGIAYQCSLRSKVYGKQEKLKKRMSLPITPSRFYDPIYVEASSKEYETQVLQMSVPIDDEGPSFDGILNSKFSAKDLVSAINYTPHSRSSRSNTEYASTSTSTSSVDSAGNPLPHHHSATHHQHHHHIRKNSRGDSIKISNSSNHREPS